MPNGDFPWWVYHALAVVVLVAIPVAISYSMALAGAPQQLWWWRDVFGIIK
jgi:hypothetical protein